MHPFLIDGVEDAETTNVEGESEVMEILINSSGKFVLLNKVCLFVGWFTDNLLVYF